MPSLLLTPASGAPFPLISGDAFSGGGFPHPVGGVQLYLDRSSSGNAYISLSGGTTVTSGGTFLSGSASGRLDGMCLAPGNSYFIPKLVCGPSGSINIYTTCDAACSGVARLYYEVF